VTTPDRQARAGLLKVLGVAFGVAIIIGNTIGVGILRTPGEIAAHLPNATIFLLLWLAGGLYALMGALSMAELGAMIPRSGGQYVFVRRGLGEYPAFVIGWSDWISTAGTASLVSMVFAEYTAQLVPSLAPYQNLLALSIIAVFTAILWAGIRTGDKTQQITSLVKALGLIALAVACIVVSGHAPSVPPQPLPHGAGLITALVVSVQAIIYTYDGWNGTFYFSGELTDPGREIPRATILGVFSIIGVYLLLNIAFLKVVPIGTMAGDPFVAATAARAVFGTAGDVIIRVIVVVGMLSTVNATLLMSSRVPVAMAEDGLIARVAIRVSPSGTPRITLLASSIVAAAFILTGSFNQVLALLAFFFVLNYAMSFISLFVLRRREPNTVRPFRVPGYPYLTGIALLGAVAFLVSGFFGDRANSVRSVIVLASSYPLYRIFRFAIHRRK
jgi:basic amino acid/polyamine antiporter, APA family